jgi:hypothetical protein
MTAQRRDQPSRLARRLLSVILPATIAGRSTLGDLIEEFSRRPRGLRRRAWFWLVSLEICAQYLPHRVVQLAESLSQDLVYAARLARKYPSLVGAAILSLSLAIGISTAGFSIANSAWLRPSLAADASIVKIWRRPLALGWPRRLRKSAGRRRRVSALSLGRVGSTTGATERR